MLCYLHIYLYPKVTQDRFRSTVLLHEKISLREMWKIVQTKGNANEAFEIRVRQRTVLQMPSSSLQICYEEKIQFGHPCS